VQQVGIKYYIYNIAALKMHNIKFFHHFGLEMLTTTSNDPSFQTSCKTWICRLGFQSFWTICFRKNGKEEVDQQHGLLSPLSLIA